MSPTSAQEQADLINTSRVLRCARKLRGLTQVEASQELNISQGMISKLESGFLSPSASLWFAATKLYNIHVQDSFETGYIDTLFNSNVGIDQKSLFKIPTKYTLNASYSMRSIAPLLNYFINKKGAKNAKLFFKKMKVDSDYFYVLDAKLNAGFVMEVLANLNKEQFPNKEDLVAMMGNVNRPSLHGHLRHLYDSAKDTKHLLKIYTENGALYESNLHYQFKELGNNMVSISMNPKADKTVDSETMNRFLFSYKKEFIKRLASYGNGKGIQSISDSVTNNKGDSVCSLEIQLIA
jgi:transcriptional regulator with XRE-family HTH domain